MVTARIAAGLAVAALSAFVVVAVSVQVFVYRNCHATVQEIHYGGGK